MKKDRFGKSKGPLSKAEIEREAQRELERLSRAAGPRPGFTGDGGSGPFGAPVGGPPTALDEVADSVRGRSAPPRRIGSPVPNLGGAGSMGAPQFGGIPGGRGAPPPSLGPDQPFYDDDEEAADEAANVTEIALRDHAARFGSDPEDLVIRQDPFAAEMMRDQAMRKFLDQQQAKEEQPRRGPSGDPVTSVLNRLAARKKAEEEVLTRGDDGSGETVLDRIRARREAIVAEQEPPAPRQLRDAPSRGGQGRSRPRMATVADDEDDGEASALAIMRARAEARRPPRPTPPRRVSVIGGPDDHDELEDEDQDEAFGEGFEDEDEDAALEDDKVTEELDGLAEDETLGEDDELDSPATPDFAEVVARHSPVFAPAPAKRRSTGRSATGSGGRTIPAAPGPRSKPAAAAGRPPRRTGTRTIVDSATTARRQPPKERRAGVPAPGAPGARATKTRASKAQGAKVAKTRAPAATATIAKVKATRVSKASVAEAPVAEAKATRVSRAPVRAPVAQAKVPASKVPAAEPKSGRATKASAARARPAKVPASGVSPSGTPKTRAAKVAPTPSARGGGAAGPSAARTRPVKAPAKPATPATKKTTATADAAPGPTAASDAAAKKAAARAKIAEAAKRARSRG